MNQKEEIEQIKEKIQSKQFAYQMDYNIHNFFLNRKDKSWDFRKIKVVGLGRPIKNNVCNFDKYIKQSDLNFLIVRNPKTNEYACMFLANRDHESPFSKSYFFEYGYPTFDVIGPGFTKQSNWIIRNILDEEFEIQPDKLKEPILMAELLNEHQLRINDYMNKSTSKKGFVLLPEVLTAVAKQEEKLK